MKKRKRTYIHATLMTVLTTALLTFGNWLGMLAFGTKCDIHGVTFSMALFCMWMIFTDEFKDFYRED